MAFIGFFVQRVLLPIDAGPLNRFSLHWHAWTISSHVICWVDAAIKRNVRELSLYLDFNCDSLQSLEVENLTFVHDATVVYLPRLESLKLDYVRFTSKETFEKLISGCPMLHYLNLTTYFRDYEDPDDVDANGDFMCVISSASLRRLDLYIEDRCTLMLKASSLEYLRLYGLISEIFVEKSLSSLVQADFDIELDEHYLLRSDEHDFLNNSIVEAVRAFEHAKFLTLSVDVMRDYCTSDLHNHSRWTAPIEVPRCLSYSLKKVRFDGYKGLEDEREMIRYMLDHGIALEVMRIRCSSKKDGEKLELLLQEICEFPRKSPACKIQFSVWPTKREFQPLY